MKISAKKLFETVFEMFTPNEAGDESVMSLLENVKEEIREIRANIDHVNDDALLDMYIYRLKAAEAQYRHLLKMARENKKKIG